MKKKNPKLECRPARSVMCTASTNKGWKSPPQHIIKLSLRVSQMGPIDENPYWECEDLVLN